MLVTKMDLFEKKCDMVISERLGWQNGVVLRLAGRSERERENGVGRRESVPVI